MTRILTTPTTSDRCTDIRRRSTVHKRRYLYHSFKRDRSKVTAADRVVRSHAPSININGVITSSTQYQLNLATPPSQTVRRLSNLIIVFTANALKSQRLCRYKSGAELVCIRLMVSCGGVARSNWYRGRRHS